MNALGRQKVLGISFEVILLKKNTIQSIFLRHDSIELNTIYLSVLLHRAETKRED